MSGPFPPIPIPPTCCNDITKEHLEHVFGAVTEQSKARTAVYRAELYAKYGAILQLLETLGSVCGACLVAKIPKPQSHSAYQCPSLSSLEKEEYKTFRFSLHYNKMKNMPCFQCHIPSGGRDEFHPPYGEECPNPSLALPLAYYIWKKPILRKKVMKDLGIDEKAWENVTAFGKWYATDDEAYFTKSLLLMHWTFTMFLCFPNN